MIAIPRNEEPDPPYGQDVVEEKDYWSPRIQHYLRALCRVKAPLDCHGTEHEARSTVHVDLNVDARHSSFRISTEMGGQAAGRLPVGGRQLRDVVLELD